MAFLLPGVVVIVRRERIDDAYWQVESYGRVSDDTQAGMFLSHPVEPTFVALNCAVDLGHSPSCLVHPEIEFDAVGLVSLFQKYRTSETARAPFETLRPFPAAFSFDETNLLTCRYHDELHPVVRPVAVHSIAQHPENQLLLVSEQQRLGNTPQWLLMSLCLFLML